MRKFPFFLFLTALIFLVPTSLAFQNDPLIFLQQTEYLPTDQILIQFEQSSAMRSADVLPSNAVQSLSAVAEVELTYKRPFATDGHVLSLPESLPYDEVSQIAQRLSEHEDIAVAEPDRIYVLNRETLTNASMPNLPPDDPRLSDQWHLDYVANSAEGINAQSAWEITTGSANIVVAVIDTGILFDHPDLAGQTVAGYDFVSNATYARDNNGRDADASDQGDWNTGVANECPFPTNQSSSSWHGSHVAGTIGANTNNGKGGAGISWNSKIQPIRALAKCGGTVSDIADGIMWASGESVNGVPNNPTPAHIINMSLGGFGSCSFFEQLAIDTAVSNGTTVVVASGNSSDNANNYSPGNCNNVINVTSTNKNGQVAYYSNTGSVVDVAAPGGEQAFGNDPNGVLSTANSGLTTPSIHNYQYYQGTSMAAPHVAGVVALMYARNPDIVPNQVESLLKKSVREFPAGSGCTTAICGAGIVDAETAVNCTPTTVTTKPIEFLGGLYEVYLPIIVKACT